MKILKLYKFKKVIKFINIFKNFTLKEILVYGELFRELLLYLIIILMRK